jgi:hypothetical protein
MAERSFGLLFTLMCYWPLNSSMCQQVGTSYWSRTTTIHRQALRSKRGILQRGSPRQG